MAKITHPAVSNLYACQRQLDQDGCEVGVSRQALDEALALAESLFAALVAIRDGNVPNGSNLVLSGDWKGFCGALQGIADHAIAEMALAQ